MKKQLYGKTKEGKDVFCYTMTNKNGMEVSVIDFGAILLNVIVPDKSGEKKDVVLGCDCLDTYYDNSNFFGSTIGPSANRIAGAVADIDGVTYHMDKNDGENNLHSNIPHGMNKRLWEAKENDNSVIFTTQLVDGDMGLPGNRSFTVTYTLTDENEVKIDYLVTSDCNTIINMTNHSYFNLAGHDSGDILSHELQLNASHYTPVVAGAIPTGEIATVKDTPLDFTSSKLIGKEMEADFEQLKLVMGYDHNFVTDNYDGNIRKIAEVVESVSGRKMEVFTDLPGVQFYTGNHVEHAKGKDGAIYEKRAGFCLETQFYPDTIHHSNFPSAIFGVDKPYKSTTIYKFN